MSDAASLVGSPAVDLLSPTSLSRPGLGILLISLPVRTLVRMHVPYRSVAQGEPECRTVQPSESCPEM